MKELSIEEKAKRYDEAIKVARSNYETIVQMDNDCTFAKEGIINTFHHMFPELKESEDERIRKGIIKGLRAMKCSFRTISSIKIDDAIAWLEKQGEHKHTAEEVLIKVGLKPYKDGDQWCVLLGDNIQEGICGFGNTIEDALYAFLKDLIASRGEHKPVVIIPKFRVGDEIKTSNEESLTITKIDEKGYWSEDLFICGFDDADKWELVEQKPAWSEEDENLFRCAIDAVEQESKVRTDGCLDEEVGGMVTDWLKSLKERVGCEVNCTTTKEWKPSDEQMEQLKKYCPDNRPLTSLYKQLKKLKG